MSVGVLQRLDRRGFLAAAAAAFAVGPGPSFGQTFIDDTPMASQGYERPHVAGSMASTLTPLSEPVQLAPMQAEPVQQQHADWRQFLLAGERTLTMRRDGGAVRHVRYCLADGTVDRDGYAMACHLLRDVEANKLFPMDPRLLDVLCGLQRWAEYHGRKATLQLLSGFRTAGTNAALEGAAMNSMHLHGRAADIVFEGMNSTQLGAMVKAFNSQGGTGIYVNRGFVHVDTGAARSWVSTAPSTRASKKKGKK